MTSNIKPFDLELALRGEPVMLRDDSKAFVRHHETEQVVDEDSRLWGIVLPEWNVWTAASWTAHGKWRYKGGDHKLDIIGMYPRARVINGFEVPAPETEAPPKGTVCFVASYLFNKFYDSITWRDSDAYELWLSRGLVFLSKEAAVANAKAMLGIDPKEAVTHE